MLAPKKRALGPNEIGIESIGVNGSAVNLSGVPHLPKSYLDFLIILAFGLYSYSF